MAERKNEAVWREPRKMWQINVQKDGVRKSFYSSIEGKKGKIEAEKKADKWLATSANKDNAKFGKVWDEWLQRLLKTNGEQSSIYYNTETYGRLYILPYLKLRRLASITQQDWQDVIDDLYATKKLSKATLTFVRGVMTSFWRYCHKSRYALERPDDIEIPRNAKVGVRKILQPSDLTVLMREDGSVRNGKPTPHLRCHYIYAWRFQVLTGLRPGELIGLKNEDIVGNVLTVSRAINISNVITPGKNKNARRSMVLNEYALNVLNDQRAYLKECGITSEWVFPAVDGSHAHERTVNQRLGAFCDVYGITRVTLYELRHTFVSINADVPDALLKQIVGHSESMDTRGVYGHEVEGQKEQTAALVQAALDKVLKGE